MKRVIFLAGAAIAVLAACDYTALTIPDRATAGEGLHDVQISDSDENGCVAFAARTARDEPAFGVVCIGAAGTSVRLN